MKSIVLLIGVLSVVQASAQIVTQSFTGVVYISSGGPALFGTPAGSQVTGTFTVSTGSLGTPSILGPYVGYNTWSQALPNGIPKNNSDSVSATSSSGSFSAPNLQSVILNPAFQDLQWGGGPLSTSPGGGFALLCPAGSPALPIDLKTAFPLSIPAGCTAQISLNNNLNQYFIEITLTSLGNQQVGPVTVVDPVPDLLDGPKITADRPTLASGGRVVQGIAADGIAQLVFQIPTKSAGDQVTAVLLSNCADPSNASTCSVSTSSDDDGGFMPVGVTVSPSTQLPSTISDTAVSVGSPPVVVSILAASARPADIAQAMPMAFIAYRAPIDFVRTAWSNSDSISASRMLYVQFKYLSPNGTLYYVSSPKQVPISRPPVILIHGFASDASRTWRYWGPFIDDVNAILVDYGQYIDVKSTDPPLGSNCSTKNECVTHIRQSDLGFTYNTQTVSNQIKDKIRQFYEGSNSSGQPISGVRADLVAHSMGGLIARNWTLNTTDYFAANTLSQGYIHKLITLGTPHLGTPLATLSLLPQSSCFRDFAADNADRVSIGSAVLADNSTQPGAVGELDGDGVGSRLNSALMLLKQRSADIPTATIAGKINSFGSPLATAAYLSCLFEEDPLAERYTPDRFNTIFDPHSITSTDVNGSEIATPNDGAVPITSALWNPDATSAACDDTHCFSRYAHGEGTSLVTGTFSFLVDVSSPIRSRVKTLLNTPISDLTAWESR